jgi:putative phage-type endonuclease
MKIVSLQQGTPEWFAHRGQHHNASDAAAALGASPFKSRAQLVREVATGVVAEIDDATQRRFDDGHRFEALARPIAEQIIGEELFPCVGVDGKFSASFDGLTMAFDTGFEHKTLNDDLRKAIKASVTGDDLPEHYRIQMEHQCMVSKAGRVLFMASKWDGETLVEELHCWYYPDPELRARIIAGWAQFEADVAAYVPGAPEAPVAAGKAPDRLPSLSVRVTGMVTESNLAEFKEVALTAIRSVNRDLRTDEDFADAELSVKWCTDVESRLQSARDAILAQTGSIDDVLRTMTDIGEEARRVRLDLEKLVKARKEAIKGEIVTAGREAVSAHYASINATLGAHSITMPATVGTDLAATIKGLRTLSSLRNAVDTAVAGMKIAASQRADQVRTAVAAFDAEVGSFETLFPDRVQLCATKAPEDLRNLMVARIGEHQRKLEADRERIRQQEQERADREARDRLEREQAQAELEAAKASSEGADLSPAAQVLHEAEGAQRFATHHPRTIAASVSSVRIKLGDINAAIAPLTITAEGLAQLGFHAAATDRAAKLYAAADLARICRCLSDRLASAAMKQAA